MNKPHGIQPARPFGPQSIVTGVCSDCGNVTHREPDDCSTGYGRRADGGLVCFQCCAVSDLDKMIREGRATLYLSKDKAGAWRVGNWPGSLSFHAMSVSQSRNGGGFGCQRTDAYFVGPDGWEWHAINRGDMDIARCRRTRRKWVQYNGRDWSTGGRFVTIRTGSAK